ncbi:MAG: hypothetical protein CMJ81_12365 [Planctomycetaceae bacterium]|nr:hypothetical protein [Planctomycetaceae bacterium]MBP63538.1 hypothetical protein [Planctomycetaceae bacterium]
MEVTRLMLRFRFPVVLPVLLLSWTSGCHCGPSLTGCGSLLESGVACGEGEGTCTECAAEGGECGLFHGRLLSNCWNGPDCGEVYFCSWKSDPPDYCDPCNRCGQWAETSCCRTNFWKDLVYNPVATIFGGRPGPYNEASCCGCFPDNPDGRSNARCEDTNCTCNRTGDFCDSDSPPIQNDVEIDGPPEPSEDLLPHPVPLEPDASDGLGRDLLPQPVPVELDAPDGLDQDLLPQAVLVEPDVPDELDQDLFPQPVENEQIEDGRSLFRPLISGLLGG